MKKSTIVKLLCAAMTTVALATSATATGFTKTNSYADGTFSDVKQSSWYSSEVKSTYELGFMNGKGSGKFVPDGNVTVAEAITMASRVHAIYNGKEIAKTDGKWYDMYVSYAKSNGIINEGDFDNFDRNIMRYEMVCLFANAMPDSYFPAINDVKEIPDVATTEDYHDTLKMLYNAGVVMGSTEYGDFLATNSIKRSETAAIINRVALPENRLQKTLKEYGDRDQAVYLIDNYEMTRTVNSVLKLSSAWTYENTGSHNINTSDTTSNALADDSEDGYVAIHRYVTPQTKGTVKVEMMYTLNKNSDARIYFSDSNGDILFELDHKNGKLYGVGDSEQESGTAVTSGSHILYLELDIDSKKAKVVYNGENVGTFDMSSKVNELARMSVSTTVEGQALITVTEVHMYVNYTVNDMFRIDNVGSAPYGWDVDGNVKIATMNSDKDVNSVTIMGKGTASKKFEKVGDKFVFETALFAPKGQFGTVTLKSGNDEAVKVEMKDGEFSADGKLVRSYTPTVWQLLRIEADTTKDTALIKVNGKDCITVPFTADSVDAIEISSDSTGPFWFDDVELYNVYDYADYCPEPVAVNDDEWYVGMSVCSLWREGTHYGWDCVSAYDEATPVLGYYDEGLAEVADWEIKMMVEHGVDFQHFCWYLNSGINTLKEPRLADALHDGYFNAKYSDKMKFSIMWENAAYGAQSTPQNFYNTIWAYWCDWYFSDSRYMTIDNKPVLTIYKYDKFVECFGSEENAKQVINYMKTDIKKLGYDGLIVLFCDRGATASTNVKMKNVGADALVSYTFGENSYDPDYQKKQMEAAFDAGTLSLLPSVGVGFNDIGWTEIRTPFATAEAHQKVYQWAKDTYLPMLAARDKENSWIGKFVFATTWNEYGEGHYISPTNVNKFGYLDAMRNVFSSVAGKNDSAHFDVEPTDNQKARLGYLYPAVNVPMRKQQYESNVSNISENEAVREWNFENQVDCFEWATMMNTTAPKFDAEQLAFTGRTTTNDGAIKTIDDDAVAFSADEAKYLYIKMKVSGVATSGNLFFKHNLTDGWDGKKGYSFSVAASDDYQEIIVDLSSNTQWKGTIASLRFDPTDTICDYSIKRIAFLTDKSAGSLTIEVDGTEHVVPANQIKTVGNDLYVAANPSDGFYSIHNLYYEYNRENGTLMIKANNGKTMNLTVGSNVAVIDGKETKLSAVTERYDGLVYVPLKQLYDMADFDYSVDKDGKYIVKIRPEEIVNAANTRVDNQYEFNVAGDTEGWIVKCGNGSVANGVFGFSATPVTSTTSGYDPQIQLTGARIETKYYKNMEIRFRVNLADQTAVMNKSQLYFATDEDPGLSEKKSVKFDVADYEPDALGFYTVNIDMTTNEAWNGTVNTVRFDPCDLEGYFEVDYIRFYADAAYEEEIKAAREEQERIEALKNAVNEGGPFYVENADAEDTTVGENKLAGSSVVTVVEDDLRRGNHAFLVTPRSTAQTWAYFIAPTRFKPGVTYKVELDLRVVSDHNGEPVKTTIAGNFRYSELTEDGALKESADHAINIDGGTISSDDGWLHCSFTHTVDANSPLRSGDKFTLFANPVGDSSNFKNVIFMVDNIEISVVEDGE